jgi:hypothetical protein
MKQFNGVYPISGEDLSALPVKAIGPAVAFYQSVLGFSVVASDEATATLQREDVRLGLVRTGSIYRLSALRAPWPSPGRALRAGQPGSRSP